MPKFDAVVLASRSEGFHLALNEAFLAGIPFFGSDIPEIAEIIRHGKTVFSSHLTTLRLSQRFSKISPRVYLPCKASQAGEDFLASSILERMTLACQRLYERVCQGAR